MANRTEPEVFSLIPEKRNGKEYEPMIAKNKTKIRLVQTSQAKQTESTAKILSFRISPVKHTIKDNLKLYDNFLRLSRRQAHNMADWSAILALAG